MKTLAQRRRKIIDLKKRARRVLKASINLVQQRWGKSDRRKHSTPSIHIYEIRWLCSRFSWCVRAILLNLVTLLAISSQAEEVIPPKPERYFNDYAGFVSPAGAQRFNEKLAQFERETSDKVIVAIFPKVQSDADIAGYTQRVAQAWGVGPTGPPNSLALFVFVQDRIMFIQGGHGLERALPDIRAFQPHFRNGDYEGAIAAEIDSICKAIRREYPSPSETAREQHRRHSLLVPFLFFSLLGLLSLAGGLHRTVRRGYGYSNKGGGWSIDWLYVVLFWLDLVLGRSSGGDSDRSSSGGAFRGGGGSFGGGGAGSSW